jgi:hypothetical protein
VGKQKQDDENEDEAAVTSALPIVPTVHERSHPKMATQPTVQTSNLNPATEDVATSAVSGNISPIGVDRAARKKSVLSKLREDAYPLHHEWVFWHERLDRQLPSSPGRLAGEISLLSPSPDTKLSSIRQEHDTAPVNKPVDVSHIAQDMETMTVVGDDSSVPDHTLTSNSQDLHSLDGGLAKQSANDATHRFGLPNTAPSTSDAEADKMSAAPSYEETLVPLMNVSTVKKFWETTNNFDIGTLRLKDTIHMFKKTVKPVWEDPRNVRGGSWTFRLNKSISAQAWVRVQLMAIGETLQDVVLPGLFPPSDVYNLSIADSSMFQVTISVVYPSPSASTRT